MKIAFYKGLHRDSSLLDKGICIASFSRYSHCEIVFSDGLCASSSWMDGGVRFKAINIGSGNWDVYGLSIPDVQEALARSLFNLHEGSGYDVRGAVAARFGVDWRAKDAFFCSGICAEACGIDSCQTPGSLFSHLGSLGLLKPLDNFMGTTQWGR
jgi:hypothetical protein